MTDFTPGDYGEPQFLFTDGQHGYPPAVAWAGQQKPQPARHRRHSQQWGAWLRRRHFARLAERPNAFARLASTAERQGYFAGEKRQ